MAAFSLPALLSDLQPVIWALPVRVGFLKQCCDLPGRISSYLNECANVDIVILDLMVVLQLIAVPELTPASSLLTENSFNTVLFTK